MNSAPAPAGGATWSPATLRCLVLWPLLFLATAAVDMYVALGDEGSYGGGFHAIFLGCLCCGMGFMYAIFVGLPVWLCRDRGGLLKVVPILLTAALAGVLLYAMGVWAAPLVAVMALTLLLELWTAPRSWLKRTPPSFRSS